MPQMARKPYIELPWPAKRMTSRGGAAGLRKARLGHQVIERRRVNHYLHFAPMLCPRRSLLSAVQYAIHFSAFGLLVPPCGLGSMGRQPGFHHFQPGGRLRGRPVPRQGRKMRGPRRPVLLSVAEFRPSHLLPAGRPRRNHRLGAEGRRKLWPFGLQRIRCHYLPALKRAIEGPPGSPPQPRPGNDVTPPREAGKGSRKILTSAAFGRSLRRCQGPPGVAFNGETRSCP